MRPDTKCRVMIPRAFPSTITDVVAEFAQGRCGGRPCEPGPDDNHGELSAIGRIHQLHVEAVFLPFLFEWPTGLSSIELHVYPPDRPITPVKTRMGSEQFPITKIATSARLAIRMVLL